jgi:hypothetical protein
MRHELWVLLVILFAWPAGIVVGNLIASVFWLPIQYLGLHLKLAAHHDALHDHLDAIEHLLDDCPKCGHRRSASGLLPSMTASSIADDSNHAEA